MCLNHTLIKSLHVKYPSYKKSYQGNQKDDFYISPVLMLRVLTWIWQQLLYTIKLHKLKFGQVICFGIIQNCVTLSKLNISLVIEYTDSLKKKLMDTLTSYFQNGFLDPYKLSYLCKFYLFCRDNFTHFFHFSFWTMIYLVCVNQWFMSK
jgi:hypothetical protein